MKYLRIIRTAIAIPMFLMIVYLFIDFGSMELRRLWWITDIQFAPATLSFIAGVSSAVVLVALLLLTLIFGRVYCSVICPMGLLQDIIARIPLIGKKKNKRKKYKYNKAHNILRYSILAGVTICLVTGFSAALAWLDPYGNFGRIAKNIFGLIYIGINNLASTIGLKSLYYVSPKSFEMFTFGFSVFILLAVAVTVMLRGRLVCNTVCPVGALLSLVSRHSMFKIKLNDNCNSCGLCAMHCKSQCIDSKKKTLDFSRCVTCYNCIDSCKHNAVGYEFAWKPKQKPDSSPVIDKATTVDRSKRRFVTSTVVVAGAAIAAKAQGLKPAPIYKRQNAVTPPGSQSLKHLLSKCTACHLCVAQCPTQVLKPAFMEYGIGGMMMPVMNYKAAYCNFECTLCSEICPNGALIALETEQKTVTQIGKVQFIREICVVYVDEKDCGACSEHCPTKAISMVEYKEVLRIPEIDPDICIGCGGCEYICPVRPLTAMYIEGNPVHVDAQKPPEGTKDEREFDSFGF